MHEPSKALVDQPLPAQVYRIAQLAHGSEVQVAHAVHVALGNMGRHVRLPHRANEFIALVTLVVPGVPSETASPS